MSRVLVAPDLQRSYAISADWLELLALSRPEGFSTDRDLLQPNDILEDRSAPLPDGVSGPLAEDPDILDVAAEPMLDALFDEIGFRSETLGEGYPFVLSTGLRNLKLAAVGTSADPIVEQGREIYRACLFMSAVRSGLLDARTAGLPCDPTIGNLFQICATIAAAGYVHGDAYWFGHPRPDRTPMLSAVAKLAELLKQGTARQHHPLGGSVYAKDGGVDVVAWRSHKDGRPAKLILYGQCASGMNWEGKPVSSKVDSMDRYYTDRPSRYWLPALLTPFPLYMDKENSHALSSEEARQGFYRQNEAEMGVILDRLRVVQWGIEGLRHPQPSMAAAVDALGDLFSWARKATAAISEAV